MRAGGRDVDGSPAVPGREILRCEVGSTLHGIGVGFDDTDYMAVSVEPRSAVTGLGAFEHLTWRTAAEGTRSQSHDVDLVVYGLKKYLRLATSGNPTVILLLYASDPFVVHADELGHELRALRSAIVSQACRSRYLGYLDGQRRRVLESRSERWEKWASHMVRLGFQGLELFSTGTLTLPMPEEQASYCRAIKRGEVSMDDALATAQRLQEQLASADRSALPEAPDLDEVESWMDGVYRRVLWHMP